MDTIYALASGSYHAGVAVVRISGARASATLQALSGKGLPDPRTAHLLKLHDENGSVLDHALVLYFKSPASFTGEDVVELHLHGGRAVIDGVLAALSRMEGLRLAEPGEFTRRAFENGKMDLTAAEAVADLIAAETEAQRTQALDQLGGGLSQLYEGWAGRLTKVLAHQEADIEFPDEDMPDGVADALKPEIQDLLSEIAAHLDDNRRGERLRDGIQIAIIGAPNAGKSSLLNALAQRDAAIVSDIPGTTRDVIDVHLDLGGYPVIVTDTAGLRETRDDIESEGIRRAQKAADRADIVIALYDSTQAYPEHIFAEDKTIPVFSKADLMEEENGASSLPPSPEQKEKGARCSVGHKKGGGVYVSSVTGTGMDDLLSALVTKINSVLQHKNKGPSLTRQRHRDALKETHSSLLRAFDTALPELAAEDLRLALRALGSITGRVHVEELLDRIFKDFCIGK